MARLLLSRKHGSTPGVAPVDIWPRSPPPTGGRRGAFGPGAFMREAPGLFFSRDRRTARLHSSTMFEFRIEGDVARIVLSRPQARNAIPLAGWDALAETAGDAAAARVLILSGTAQAFCAGADLDCFAAMKGDAAAAATFREAMRRGIEAVASLAMPTIALVEGPCYGAGVALALACDMRLAGAGARFAITPAKMGISYPQEDVFRLVALVGRAQAAKLLFTGAAIDAAEAMRIGLADGAAEEREDILAAILANDPAGLATLKRGIGLAGSGIRSDAAQDAAFDALVASDAFAARLEARRRR